MSVCSKGIVRKSHSTNVVVRQEGGFTLLEIMVALSILALLAAAITSQSRHSVSSYQRIENIREATMLAENAVEKILLEREFPMLGVRELGVSTARGSRKIRLKVSSTSQVNLRQLDVDVVDPGVSHDASIVTLRAYVGRH